MIPKELISQIKKIEIKSKKLVDSLFAGNFRSAFKGRGLEFDGIRQYIRGDEYKTIDWKVTAKFNKPYVKVFKEERELIIMLLVDISNSINYGTISQTKRELVAEFCATIALSAVASGDSVGLIMFTDKIEKFIPPKKGRTHALRLIREILYLKPDSNKTNISEALIFLNRVIKRRCISFIASDFNNLDNQTEKMLAINALKHDTIAIVLNDRYDVFTENVGLVNVFDLETNEFLTIDTSSEKIRNQLKDEILKKQKNLNSIFKKYDIDSIQLFTDKPIQKPLIEFFKQRENTKIR